MKGKNGKGKNNKEDEYLLNYTIDNDEDTFDENKKNQFFKPDKKKINKIGRTLMIRCENINDLSQSLINNLEGLVKESNIINDTVKFLTFDTPENALNALKQIKRTNVNIYIKFGYYKIFFLINGLTSDSVYSDVKKELIDFIKEKIPDSNVLYCKLYNNNTNYLGCGDLTVDTIETMMELISKTSLLKNFIFNEYSGSFFKFNSKNKEIV